jgi:uncharacterized membrane protein YdjX (TVP38/TMEM64 family)
VIRIAVPVVLIALLAALWQLTPLGDQARELAEKVLSFRNSPATPLIVTGAYVVAGLAVVPLSALVLATVVGFGALYGGAYAMLGALASAAALFAIGRFTGRDAVERLLGDRARRVADRVARRGVLTVALLRNVPIAPYSLVNLVAGASPLGFGQYLLGTFIGLLPGLLILVFAGDSLRSFLDDPELASLLPALALVALLATLSIVLARRVLAEPEREP